MPRGGGKVAAAPRKADLPTRTCPVCGLPFAWRRKWRRDWENVRYCSDRCRRIGAPSGDVGDDATAPRR